MKAFLLAAGLGTRLKPLTDNIPKCLIPIKGKPLLGRWLDLLEKHKVDEVLINVHCHPELVEKYVKSYNSKVIINLYYEKELLGSAGTLMNNKEFIKNEKSFYIIYVDNYTNINLTDFYTKFESSSLDFGMVLFRTKNPKDCGIAELNEEKTVIKFEEKPRKPCSNLANAGIYLSKPNVLNLIPLRKVTDIGFDLLPLLINKMFGYETKDFLIDIGTLENLKIAEKHEP